MYDSDKSLGRRWCDSVGWAILDKVPTVDRKLQTVRQRDEKIEARRKQAREKIAELSRELWAAVSVGLMLIVLVAAYQWDHLIGILIPSIALFAFVEAGFRGRLTSLLGSVNSAIAVVAALVLLYQFL